MSGKPWFARGLQTRLSGSEFRGQSKNPEFRGQSKIAEDVGNSKAGCDFTLTPPI